MMDKFKSRKFLVWVIWTVLMGFAFFCKVDAGVLGTIAQYYGIISIVYIGANALTKSIINKEELK